MRHRHRGRAHRRGRGRRCGRHPGVKRLGGDLSDPAGAIRPAVESALTVARAGLTADPVVIPPPALRRYLTFSRLTARSLDVIARVVERDPEFRRRVAEAVDEAQVGRAGWLWLARPDGWADELAEIEADLEDEAATEAAAREERSATKKLAAAQAAAARSETEATARRREADELRIEVKAERAARVTAEERVAQLEVVIAELRDGRAEVVRNLKDVEARLVERATEANATKARLRALEAELDGRAGAGRTPRRPAGATEPVSGTAPAASDRDAPSGSPPGARSPGDPPSVDVPAGHGPSVEPSAGRGSSGSPRPGRGPAVGSAPFTPGAGRVASHQGTGGADPAVLAAEVARAADGAAVLADALAGLTRLLAADHRETAGGTSPGARGQATTGATAPGPGQGDSDDGGGGDHDRDSDGGAATSSDIARAGIGTPPRSRPRREPVALPGGMFDDTVEAADHLLRTPGAVLIVDGYNVTMKGWPDLPVADQRRRLVAALTDLAARVATRVELVFDGAEVEPLSGPGAARQLVRVRFSDPGVEADDVVLDLVGRLPAATPVIVASSDNRVRDGSRRNGANLLHADQLLGVLCR